MDNLMDPAADYCRAKAKTLMRFVKSTNRIYYKLFRTMGCSASDSIKMARGMTQEDVNKIDLSVNFDGPMA